ncbi:alpha/beta hydrolase [Marinomonas flavescens]|uniref:alpha/beta hydrolase n=1 Tax=Marinomonas flavescens TaxID=2529379 RepID=UPI001054B02C|nr:alpha/beta fold hydrolase [Marinomonas flavescens]
MTIKRLEVSNPAYTPNNTQFLTIHSSYLERRHDVSIYNINAQGKDVPIIVLLHGVYGNHWVWMHLGGVHLVYEKLKKANNLGEFVLVMPSDGGLQDGSAYLPTSNHGNYEQWIMEDVLDAVIDNVACVSSNSHIYLTGLSMGGYGALRLGAKYADRISGISAHSAITKLEQICLFTDTPLDQYACLNIEQDNLIFWITENAATLPPLRFDCGEDDLLYEANVELHNTLDTLNIKHQFEHFTGEHSWPYWHQHIEQTFQFFNLIESEQPVIKHD